MVAPPTVTTVSPTAGPVGGGTTVTITGTGFTGANAVAFGATPAIAFTVNSPTTITATAPAHASGVVDVSVTTPLGGRARSTSLATSTPSARRPSRGQPDGGTDRGRHHCHRHGHELHPELHGELRRGSRNECRRQRGGDVADRAFACPRHWEGRRDGHHASRNLRDLSGRCVPSARRPSRRSARRRDRFLAAPQSPSRARISPQNSTVSFGGTAGTNVVVNGAGQSLTVHSPAHTTGTST